MNPSEVRAYLTGLQERIVERFEVLGGKPYEVKAEEWSDDA